MAACALFASVIALAPAAQAKPLSRTQRWLFVSDIHLDPYGSDREPSPLGRDTSPALFRSALAAMKAAVPEPQVIAIEGDLLGHRLDRRVHEATERAVERGFAQTFPHAHFVIVLGNNDSGCVDYGVGIDSPFLAASARLWQPLVDRDGAAPDFVSSFSHDGFARIALPVPNVQALAIDDTYWTPRYTDACKTGADPSATMAELERAIDTGPRGEKYWIVMHVPPGVDAFSTAYSRGLVDVPFLRPSFRRSFEQLVARGRIRLVLAGHTHKFGYRVIGAGGAHPVALLGVPALSPIYDNAPAFLSANVSADGTLSAIREIAYDGNAWHDIGGFPSLGVEGFTPRALLSLTQRLSNDAQLRDTFGRLYEAGGRREIDENNRRIYLCATTQLDSNAFRRCAGRIGFDPLSPRGLVIATVIGLLALGAATIAVLILIRRPATARGAAR